MKDIQILIVPDVHCRDFWRAPVIETLSGNPTARAVFLGDYLDGYADDFEAGIDYRTKGIEYLREIIALKKQYKERIILLLGNHDATYAIDEEICCVRTDTGNFPIIEKLFKDNRDCFQLAYEETINRKHLIFSHAGISKGWIDYNFPDAFINDGNVVDFLNRLFRENGKDLYRLGQYDLYRGYNGYSYGSPLWMDLRSSFYMTEDDLFGDFQIVGHTQLSSDMPQATDYIGDFDCRAVFYVDSECQIHRYG